MINGLEKAISTIEERDDMKKFDPAKNILHRKIKHLLRQKEEKRNWEELGVCYYYSLRIQLKSHLHEETDENIETYEKMIEAFKKHESFLKKQIKELPRKAEEYSQKKGELKSFYKRITRFYFALETIYDKKNFIEGEKSVYGEKMYIHEKDYWINKKYTKWFEFFFLKMTNDYGRSFVRWGISGMCLALSFALLYYFLDGHLVYNVKGELLEGHNFIDYIYFSIITFTTLGYGDIVPFTTVAKILATIEVFFGYIMLGMFINLIQRRL